MTPSIDTTPISCPRQVVRPEWIDYNGHLNMAYYHVLFDKALDHVFDLLGIGEAYVRSGQGSCFVLEVHVHYLQELSLGDPVDIRCQLLDYDTKRIHFIEQMFHGEQGYLAATSEQLTLHVSMETRRSALFPQSVLDRLATMRRLHADLPVPAQVGHTIGIRRAGSPAA